ncbi:peptidoglycan-binding protein [Piscinibacter sp.]|uniref:CIS tube protein n=1 Tax=Piscinibacter sp. TaxID=1903157 RepID=UPI002BF690E5|nr:peptidoglycan-binding protein [Albitalea sp.]HUG26168.1 peptidoglycan-binding protein [Albitalea sp.]
MPDPATGQKTRLLMTRYSVSSDGTIALDSSTTFTVMLNPADFKHSFGISYDKQKKQGEPAADPKFSAVDAEKVNFSIVIDGTGAVPAEAGTTRQDVKAQLAQLNKVVYQYVGEKHEPPHVRLLWGTLIFFGRLESMTTNYTLFKPSGDPLRAKVDLGFVGAMSKKEAELVSNRSSPDLSHRVLVREGDTLPLLCHRIYGDSWYYLDVARFNRLVEFRNLKPGLELHFPPLE